MVLKEFWIISAVGTLLVSSIAPLFLWNQFGSRLTELAATNKTGLDNPGTGVVNSNVPEVNPDKTPDAGDASGKNAGGKDSKPGEGQGTSATGSKDGKKDQGKSLEPSENTPKEAPDSKDKESKKPNVTVVTVDVSKGNKGIDEALGKIDPSKSNNPVDGPKPGVNTGGQSNPKDGEKPTEAGSKDKNTGSVDQGAQSGTPSVTGKDSPTDSKVNQGNGKSPTDGLDGKKETKDGRDAGQGKQSNPDNAPKNPTDGDVNSATGNKNKKTEENDPTNPSLNPNKNESGTSGGGSKNEKGDSPQSKKPNVTVVTVDVNRGTGDVEKTLGIDKQKPGEHTPTTSGNGSGVEGKQNSGAGAGAQGGKNGESNPKKPGSNDETKKTEADKSKGGSTGQDGEDKSKTGATNGNTPNDNNPSLKPTNSDPKGTENVPGFKDPSNTDVSSKDSGKKDGSSGQDGKDKQSTSEKDSKKTDTGINTPGSGNEPKHNKPSSPTYTAVKEKSPEPDYSGVIRGESDYLVFVEPKDHAISYKIYQPYQPIDFSIPSTISTEQLSKIKIEDIKISLFKSSAWSPNNKKKQDEYVPIKQDQVKDLFKGQNENNLKRLLLSLSCRRNWKTLGNLGYYSFGGWVYPTSENDLKTGINIKYFKTYEGLKYYIMEKLSKCKNFEECNAKKEELNIIDQDTPEFYKNSKPKYS